MYSRPTDRPMPESAASTNSALYDLRNQIALVTGGAQGLGLAIAEQLARCGAIVTIGDLQEEKAHAAAATLRQQSLPVTAMKLDIADSQSVDGVFETIASQAGHLNILVTS